MTLGKKKRKKYNYIVEYESFEPERIIIRASSKAAAIKIVCEEEGLTKEEILNCYKERK